MRDFKIFLDAIMAGICIGIGGIVYLSLDNKVLGAMLFTVGLFAVCTFGYNLYTGKVAYLFDHDKRYIGTVVIIWLGNLVGTWFTAWLMSLTRNAVLAEKAMALCEIKLGDNLFSIFILGIFCNLLIVIGVDGYKNNRYIEL